MRQCLDLAVAASGSSAPIMISGESGSGKSLLARQVHSLSPRRSRPCVTLHCPDLRESELRAFLLHYHYPGNISKLFGIVLAAARVADQDTIYVEDIGLVVDAGGDDPHLFSNHMMLPLAEMEKRHINKALLRTGWKRNAAARILGISATMLERKMKLYGLGRDGNGPS